MPPPPSGGGIKTLALPKLIYSASITEIPHGISKQIEKLIYKLIWKSKDRIKRNYIMNTIANGGLNMIDIEFRFLALKAAWVARILQDDLNF